MQRFEKATVLYAEDPVNSEAWKYNKNDYSTC